MLFTVEEERADNAAIRAEQEMLSGQADQDKMVHELERLRRMENKLQGKTSSSGGGGPNPSSVRSRPQGAPVLSEREDEDTEDRTIEEEAVHWQQVAREREEELEMVSS